MDASARDTPGASSPSLRKTPIHSCPRATPLPVPRGSRTPASGRSRRRLGSLTNRKRGLETVQETPVESGKMRTPPTERREERRFSDEALRGRPLFESAGDGTIPPMGCDVDDCGTAEVPEYEGCRRMGKPEREIEAAAFAEWEREIDEAVAAFAANPPLPFLPWGPEREAELISLEEKIREAEARSPWAAHDALE
ncbi:unnamed protein product [Ostreobium quekettii]|uniref:Uncharacterized protein n=1 Tax=Ostreobium quekettii TaxID=121088 RepID=A0A8S1IJS9_9CHLO|nr:unnamed protein product [Ostreobium quekettii]